MGLKEIIPIFIVLSLISILFFPMDQINRIGIPIFIAALLGIIYWRLNK